MEKLNIGDLRQEYGEKNISKLNNRSGRTDQKFKKTYWANSFWTKKLQVKVDKDHFNKT